MTADPNETTKPDDAQSDANNKGVSAEAPAEGADDAPSGDGGSPDA